MTREQLTKKWDGFAFEAGVAALSSRWSTRLAILAIAVMSMMLLSTESAYAADGSLILNAAGNSARELTLADYKAGGLMSEDGMSAGVLRSTQVYNFLPFIRWNGVMVIPTPAVSAASLTALPLAVSSSLTFFLFSLSSFVTLLIGIVVSFMGSITIIDEFVPTVDRITYSIIYNFFGMSKGGGIFPVVGWMLLIVIVIVVLAVTRKFAGLTIKSAVVTFLLIILLGFTGVQSAKNHSASSGVGTRNVQAGVTSVTDPTQWTPFSLGWDAAVVRKASDAALGAVLNITNSITKAVTADTAKKGEISNQISAETGACGNYMNGLLSAYNLHTPAGNAKSAAMVTQYQKLANVTYFTPLSVAMTGTGNERGDSWCRQLELARGSSGIQQVYVSILAGQDAGIITKQSQVNWSKTQYASQVTPIIKQDADGNELRANRMADSFFGPNVQAGKQAGAYKYYFAACNANGQLNPGWNMVFAADKEVKWSNAATGAPDRASLLNNNNCLNLKTFGGPPENLKKSGSGVIDLWNGLTGNDTAEGADRKQEYEAFAFANFDEGKDQRSALEVGVDAVGSFIGMGNKGAHFIASPGPAMFHTYSNGGIPGEGVAYSVIALISSIMLFRYVLPMSVGAVVVQVMGVLILAFLPVIMLAAAIPSHKTRGFSKAMLQTYISATMVSGIVAAVFGLAVVVQGVLTYSFGSTGLGGMPIIRAILSAVATIVAFKTIKIAIKALTNLNISNWKDAVKVGMAGGAPVLAHMGMNTEGMDPTKREFWMRKKSDRDNTDPTIATDETSPVNGGPNGDPTSTDPTSSDTTKLGDKARQGGEIASKTNLPFAGIVGAGLMKAGDLADKMKQKKDIAVDNVKSLFGMGNSKDGRDKVGEGITNAGVELAEAMVPEKPTKDQINRNVPNVDNVSTPPELMPGVTPAPAGQNPLPADQVKDQADKLLSTKPTVSDGRTDIETSALMHNARGDGTDQQPKSTHSLSDNQVIEVRTVGGSPDQPKHVAGTPSNNDSVRPSNEMGSSFMSGNQESLSMPTHNHTASDVVENASSGKSRVVEERRSQAQARVSDQEAALRAAQAARKAYDDNNM